MAKQPTPTTSERLGRQVSRFDLGSGYLTRQVNEELWAEKDEDRVLLRAEIGESRLHFRLTPEEARHLAQILTETATAVEQE